MSAPVIFMGDVIAAKEDTGSADMMAWAALFGTAWWGASMFTYLPTNANDSLTPAFPIRWMWTNVMSLSQGWMAASYMTTFFAFLLVSGFEFLAANQLKNGDGFLAAKLYPIGGFWGAAILYMIPPIFSMMHLFNSSLNGGIDDDSTAYGYVNDLGLTFLGWTMWIYQLMTHIMFAGRAAAHAETVKATCICRAAQIPYGASPAYRRELEDDARDACEIKCDMPEMKCDLDRDESPTYEAYKKACRAARAPAEALTEVETPAGGKKSEW